MSSRLDPPVSHRGNVIHSEAANRRQHDHDLTAQRQAEIQRHSKESTNRTLQRLEETRLMLQRANGSTPARTPQRTPV